LPCHGTCAFCNEKTCLKCKPGLFWTKGAKCQRCVSGKKIFNPAVKKCSPRKIMDYTLWDASKNGEKRFFKMPVWKSYSKPKKVPKYEDIRMIIEYKLATFKTPVSMILKNYFVKPKKKATGKDIKFQTRVKYIRKEWFRPVKHKGVLKYVHTIRFIFKIKPNKKFLFKIFPITRNSKYFKNLEVYDFNMSYTPYNQSPYLRIRQYKELNEADATKPEAPKTKVGGSSGKGGRAIAKKQGVDMMSNAVEDKQAAQVSRLDEQLALENLNDMITKLTLVKILPDKTKLELQKLRLNLDPALKRCERVNGKDNCTELWHTMAVKACPRGYDRFGCCNCVLPCPGSGFVDRGNFCDKKPPYKTQTYYSEAECRSENKLTVEQCMTYGGGIWTSRCDKGWERHGKFTCMKTCPTGWSDDGKFCQKLGNIANGLPFPWMPGD